MQNARTVRVSPSFTSDLNAVRTSGVTNTSNEITMITSTIICHYCLEDKNFFTFCCLESKNLTTVSCIGKVCFLFAP